MPPFLFYYSHLSFGGRRCVGGFCPATFFTFVSQSTACNVKYDTLYFLNRQTDHCCTHHIITFCFTSLVYGLIVFWKLDLQAAAKGFMTSVSQKTAACLRIQFELGHFFIRLNWYQSFVYHSHFSCLLEANSTLFSTK